MVQWGPGPDALFIVTMMKVHSIKPNYHAIAANMGDNFTNRSLGHRMDTLRNMADQYVSTMALQANAQATSTQASASLPATGNKRGSSATAPNAKAKSNATTAGKANNDKTATKASATKNKVAKKTPVKGVTNAGVKKRAAPAAKGKTVIKTEPKGNKEEVGMKEDGEDTDATITDGEADTQGQGEAEKMDCA